MRLKLLLKIEEKQIGRCYLYILHNDLHTEPFAYLEDVFIKESYRGQGHGATIVRSAIEEAKKRRCYKIVCTSRYGKEDVHQFYKKLGFSEHGKSFRLNFTDTV